MNAALTAVLNENLRFLKLTTIIRNLENIHWQALENKQSYNEFLLNLTQIEVQVRKENGRKRRIREAAFPLHKPFETFDFKIDDFGSIIKVCILCKAQLD